MLIRNIFLGYFVMEIAVLGGSFPYLNVRGRMKDLFTGGGQATACERNCLGANKSPRRTKSIHIGNHPTSECHILQNPGFLLQSVICLGSDVIRFLLPVRFYLFMYHILTYNWFITRNSNRYLLEC